MESEEEIPVLTPAKRPTSPASSVSVCLFAACGMCIFVLSDIWLTDLLYCRKNET